MTSKLLTAGAASKVTVRVRSESQPQPTTAATMTTTAQTSSTATSSSRPALGPSQVSNVFDRLNAPKGAAKKNDKDAQTNNNANSKPPLPTSSTLSASSKPHMRLVMVPTSQAAPASLPQEVSVPSTPTEAEQPVLPQKQLQQQPQQLMASLVDVAKEQTMNEHFATLDSTNDQIKELLASTIAFAESLLIPQVQ